MTQQEGDQHGDRLRSFVEAGFEIAGSIAGMAIAFAVDGLGRFVPGRKGFEAGAGP